MLIRPLRLDEKRSYNKIVDHPLQLWEWGQFKQKTGQHIDRLGFYGKGKLKNAIQVSFHKIPFIGGTAGYLARGYMPDEEQIAGLKQLAKQNNALFIKVEPNINEPVGVPSGHHTIAKFLEKNGAVPAKHILPQFTFVIDLKQTEDDLFAKLTSKTRYNVNLAYKKGVQIVEDTSKAGMDQYIEILKETTKRQSFYAHSPKYFEDMWEVMGESGMIRIFQARYEEKVLTSWVMFVLGDVLYYPYGASLRIHRDAMANNLMAWEMIKFGKSIGCKTFDMWGSLGPEPDKKHSWYGFHRFKKSYGGTLYQSVGSYDLVINPNMYKLFLIADSIRWKVLDLKAALKL